MPLSQGRKILAIPGPSVIPDRVLNAMHRASPNIYEGEIVSEVEGMIPDLRAVARTEHEVAIYICNGHGAWEASLRNVVKPGDRILAIQTGRFGTNWGVLASQMGVDVQKLDFGMQSPADANKLEEVLRADTEGKIKAVTTVQVDTATSVKNDVAELKNAIVAAGHDALFMVDCIASLGCDRYEMDAWGADVTVAACQKGLMTPPGLGFVYFNDKAKSFRKHAVPGQYWDWVPRAEPEIFYQYFGGTPPVSHLYGLREALDMLVHEEGIENVWSRHEALAGAYWAALDAWGSKGSMKHNIADRAFRTVAVSTIETAEDDAQKIRDWCEKEAGVTLGIGIGFGTPSSAEARRRFRIGHMGHNNIPMMMGVAGAIDAAMKALGIEHGEGALDAASRALAASVNRNA